MEHARSIDRHRDRVFVEHHVRRIALELGVTNGIAELAVVDALNALDFGCPRDVAINTGVSSARSAARAHFARPVRPRPVLCLVRNDEEPAEDQPPPEVLWHSPRTYIVLVAAALLLAAAIVFGTPT